MQFLWIYLQHTIQFLGYDHFMRVIYGYIIWVRSTETNDNEWVTGEACLKIYLGEQVGLRNDLDINCVDMSWDPS